MKDSEVGVLARMERGYERITLHPPALMAPSAERPLTPHNPHNPETTVRIHAHAPSPTSLIHVPHRRRWRLLVPANLFQVIRHVLLIKGLLRHAGLILVRGPEARRVGRQDLISQRDTCRRTSKLKLRIRNDDALLSRIIRRLLVN